MYLLSEFGFLFLLQEDLPTLSFFPHSLLLPFHEMHVPIYPEGEWLVECVLGLWISGHLCSVPALTCDLYSHHLSYMEFPHLWNRAVADSSWESNSVLRGDTIPYCECGQCPMKWIPIHILCFFKCLETNFEDTTTVSLIGFLNVKTIIPSIMHRFEIPIYTMH